MTLPEEDLEFQIAKLTLVPGDAIVARVDRPITSEASARLQAALERAIPRTKVVVISPGVDLTVVSKVEAKKLEAGK
jgi:hypothetical protein